MSLNCKNYKCKLKKKDEKRDKKDKIGWKRSDKDEKKRDKKDKISWKRSDKDEKKLDKIVS